MGAKRKRARAGSGISNHVPPPLVEPVSPSAVDDEGSDRDVKEVVAILMAQGLGEALDEDRARALALETKREDGGHGNVEAWAEACLVALACDNEIDDEATDVAIAMADSLRRAEVAQASSTSVLETEPQAVVLEHFLTKSLSQVAGYLIDSNRSESLDQRQLYELLDLEAGCAKWYPSSRHYFRELVDGLRHVNEDQARKKITETVDLIRCVIL